MDKVLQQFLAIAEAGTISGAATTLFVTQPTLTFNMKKLEDSLGVPLFVRTSRGITLTSYGETLYENTRVMRRLYDNTIASIEEQRARREQGLNIGTGYSWWSLFLKDLILDYRQKNPNAPIYVSIGNQLRCMDQLLSGDTSLFIGHEVKGMARDTGTTFIPLTQVHNGYFVRAGHPLLGKPRKLTELEEYPAVVSNSPETRHLRLFGYNVRERADIASNAYKFAFASNSLAACLDYIKETDAVFCHSAVMSHTFRQRDVYPVIIEDENVLERFNVGIYVLHERMEDMFVSRLIDDIKVAAARVVPAS